jgi:hypothetical protein
VWSFDFVINFAAFVPMGFFWFAASTRASPGNTTCRRVQLHGLSKWFDLELPDVPNGREWRNVLQAAIVCLLIAATAEGLQLFIQPRTASLLDVAALESGALLGCFLCWRTTRQLHTGPRQMTRRVKNESQPEPKPIPLPLVVFVACLALQCCASPAECFLMYRHRTLGLTGLGAVPDWNFANTAGWSICAAALTALIGKLTRGYSDSEHSIAGSALAVKIETDASNCPLSQASDRIGVPAKRAA